MCFITFYLKVALSEVEKSGKVSPAFSTITAEMEYIKASNCHGIAKCSCPGNLNQGLSLTLLYLELLPANTQVTACYHVRNKYLFIQCKPNFW